MVQRNWERLEKWTWLRQGRIFHCAVATNDFISVLNPADSNKCLFFCWFISRFRRLDVTLGFNEVCF